ncbi:MAG: hypothetical protein ABI995_04915, partial [Acidobacteriota bacterium]
DSGRDGVGDDEGQRDRAQSLKIASGVTVSDCDSQRGTVAAMAEANRPDSLIEYRSFRELRKRP